MTVQLFPFADTPNPGGEYKVWVAAVANSTDDKPFPRKYSKTDNFKVKPGARDEPPPDDCEHDCEDDCENDCDDDCPHQC